MNIRNNRAFTLMEILIVLFIIGFILAFVGPKISQQFFKSRTRMTELKINQLKSALLQYNQDIGHFPKKTEGGLDALYKKPEVKGVTDRWQGPYTKEEDLLDSWSNNFEYNNPPEKHKDKYKYYEVISSGGDEGKEIDGGD